MPFVYKNPITSIQVSDSVSIDREKTIGTNFSILQVGGYMEVYTLNDLNYVIPTGVTGIVEFTANTIPVKYSVKTQPFLPDSITLNSDNISSGRRRLGMLVYVNETQKTYQYVIPNYDELWSNASGSTAESDYGTIVSTSTSGGTAFVNAWLDSSIEGVSGVTRDNARWRLFKGSDTIITGGSITYDTEGTLSLNDSSGNTASITGFTTVTGGTFNKNSSTLTLTDNRGGTFLVTGFTDGNTFLTGATYSPTTLRLNMSDGVTYQVTGFSASITGGTYSDGEIILDKDDNSSVNVTGLEILTYFDYLTGSGVTNATVVDVTDMNEYQTVAYNYVINDGTNYRSGAIHGVWDGTQVRHSDVSTIDIGTTSGFEWSFDISGGNARLIAIVTSGSWDVRLGKNQL